MADMAFYFTAFNGIVAFYFTAFNGIVAFCLNGKIVKMKAITLCGDQPNFYPNSSAGQAGLPDAIFSNQKSQFG
jgi:hypothetical protein